MPAKPSMVWTVLLYHGSDLAIETHDVDTGGVSDMSFALRHLFSFQLLRRLRGLAEGAPRG